ncbi:MAG: hypothetical protein QM783_08550 [Phycisphaerales bacterium]
MAHARTTLLRRQRRFDRASLRRTRRPDHTASFSSTSASVSPCGHPGASGGGMYMPPAPAKEAEPPKTLTVSSIAGLQLARAALIDLRLQGDPTPADARYALAIFKDAVRLDSANAPLIRMAIETAQMAGDQQAVLDLCRALVKLDAQDTDAQLQIILARLALCQTIEERLAIFDSLLGPKGDSLDSAVRSRLALQAAVMKRERGDAEGFAKALTLATTLDPSNYAAAALALDTFSPRLKDPQARFELLLNTLQAAPLDPTVHAAVAHELAAAGAVDQAVRFYENARRIYSRHGRFLPLDQNAEFLVQSWKQLGPDPVVKPLNDAVESERREAQLDLDVANATGKPVDTLPTPNSFRQPVPLERVRFAAALAAGDKSTVDRSLTDYALSVAELPTNDPVRGAAEAEIAFCRGLADSGDLRPEVSRLRSTPGVTQQMLARLDAWVKYRSGNRAGGRADFEAMKDDQLAALAVAVIDAEAAPPANTPAGKAFDDRLTALVNADPLSPVSAWALTKYKARNGDKAPPVTERAEKFAAMGAGIPSWVDDGARDSSKVASVRVDPPRLGGLPPLAPGFIFFRVTNNAPVPIAVGPNLTVDNRLMIGATVDVGGRALADPPPPEVTEMRGRLRLMPREEAVFPVWIEPGLGGWAVQNHLSKTVRLRLNIMQGYIIDEIPKPGLFGASISATPVSRSSAPLTEPSRLSAEIATLSEEELALAVLQARLALLPRDKPLTVEQAKSLVTTVGDRYRRASAAERIAILTIMPTPRMVGAAVDLERVLAQIDETDPAVVRAALLTRVDDPASPLIAKYRAVNDPGVQEAIKLVEARLANSDSRCFARISFRSEQPTAPSKPKTGGDTPQPPAGTPVADPAATPAATPPPASPSDKPDATAPPSSPPGSPAPAPANPAPAPAPSPPGNPPK